MGRGLRDIGPSECLVATAMAGVGLGRGKLIGLIVGWFLFSEVGIGRREKGVLCWIWRRRGDFQRADPFGYILI